MIIHNESLFLANFNRKIIQTNRTIFLLARPLFKEPEGNIEKKVDSIALVCYNNF